MDDSKITIQDVSMEWLNMKRLTVKQSTFSTYYCIVKREIIPELGEIPLERLNSSTINAFTSKKMRIEGTDNKKGLGNTTVRDINVVLKSIIKYAEREYQMCNLAENTVVPRVKREKIETLTEEEVQTLSNYLWEYRTDARCAGILLCMYSGMRLGEICALRWEDIDLSDKIIHVRHTLQRIVVPDENSIRKTQIVIDEPKTASSIRTIPISNQIYQSIKNIRGKAEESCFFLTNTDRFVEPRNYQYFFKRVLQKKGIRSVNFHILRHTFATQCVAVGMDVKTLSEILGHANINITLNYYVHSSIEMKRKQINLLKL